MDKSKTFSRRDFMRNTAAGAVLGLTALSGLAGCSTAESKKPAEKTAGTNTGKVEWPYPYVKLDPEVIRKKAHKAYYEGACCYGVFHPIIEELREKVGEPYTAFPTDMMKYGEGGIVGWTTVCGSLNGASAAICLIAGEENYKGIVHDLMGWYTEFPFPSDKSNQYAEEKAFLVDKLKYDKALGTSISNSPLCHQSVTNWCKATGFSSGSSERSERCARVTADVAAKAVELLNANFDNNFKPVYELPEEVENCRACHAKGIDFEKGGFTRGKMNCLPCHDNPHK